MCFSGSDCRIRETAVRDTIFSRRAALKGGAGVALGLAAARFAQAAEAVQRLDAPRPLDPRQRILIKGGALISMDPKIGNIARSVVLIEGKKIVAVGGDVSATGALPIEASNMLLIPGFVDCHRHSWEGQL